VLDLDSSAKCQTRRVQIENRLQLRDTYDEEIRRNTTPDGSGATADAGENYSRWVAEDGFGWSEVWWSSLNETNADDAIVEQIEFYRSRGLSFVWRVYDYDLPIDLGSRLLKAGFKNLGESAVMIAASFDVARESVLPAGVEMINVSDEAGVDLLIAVHESVFAHDHHELRRSILRRMDVAPREMEMFVVVANGLPISASRIEFLPENSFAALWGGSTEPAWRGKGIYRAQVFRRAQLALERGYPYLMVLASENSQPILSHLGFETISRVTTYSWEPPTTA
jgi:GNAT superfamily N-acetyltransferase